MGLRLLLRALRARNLRLFFAGQGVSLVGTWMQQVAMSWLVYRLTGSQFLLGVIGFTGQIPSFFLAPVAGVLADRWDRRRLVIATQVFALVQAAMLALLVATGAVRVWQMVVLSLVLGIVNAFDIPARQAFIVDLVEDRADLGNAIALNSSMVNAARLVGPSIAGLLVAAAGEGACFLLNAASYLAVMAALAAMRVRTPAPRRESRRLLLELREGFGYAFGSPPIRSVLLLVALVSFSGMPYAVLLPVFARDVFHGGARTYGLLMAMAGSGALAGTVYLASRRSVLGLDLVIALTAVLFGAGLIAFALSGVLLPSLLFLVVIGFGAMAFVSSCNAFLQSIVDDDKRGRAMSIYVMALVGMAPFGSLCAGALAHGFGARNTLLCGGVACVAGGVLFARKLSILREMVREIYTRKEVARVPRAL
jgi:MFS family permease